MCALTMGLFLLPGTGLDVLWRLNPEAHAAFHSLGTWPVSLLMSFAGVGCALAAIGLWQGARWGVVMALVILSINLVGDLFNTLARHDYRALIGLPIAAAMIFYLSR